MEEVSPFHRKSCRVYRFSRRRTRVKGVGKSPGRKPPRISGSPARCRVFQKNLSRLPEAGDSPETAPDVVVTRRHQDSCRGLSAEGG